MCWINRFLDNCTRGNIEAIRCMLDEHDVSAPCSRQHLAQYYYIGLKRACSNGHTDLAETLLLRCGKRISEHIFYFGCETALMAASKNGHVKVVETLLNFGLEQVHLNGKHGLSALCLAAKGGHLAVCQLLLRNGARGSLGPALATAAAAGQTALCEFFLLNGANVETNCQGGTPLMFAIRNGHINTVQLLLQRGASLRAKVKGETCLKQAVRCEKSRQMLDLLLHFSSNLNLNEKDPETGDTLLGFALLYGYQQAANWLVQHSDMIADDDPATLYHAIHSQNLNLLRRILGSNSSKIDLANNLAVGQKALQMALTQRFVNLEIIRLLISHGASLQTLQCGDQTLPPLHLAIVRDNYQLVKLLLEAGVDCRLKVDHCGNSVTPLILAASFSQTPDILDLLLDHVGSFSAEELDEALLFAAYNGQTVAAKMLLESGAWLETRSRRKGSTPLLLAAMKGHLETVRFFIAKGADLNAINKDAFNASMLAKLNNHDAIVNILNI